MEPTLVITAGRGNAKVVTRLYGPVDDARIEREKAEAEHRADQLDTSMKPKKIHYIPDEDVSE